MTKRRVGIAWLMTVFLPLSALATAVMAYATRHWGASEAGTAAALVFLSAFVLSRFQNARRRPSFLLGFGAFGAAYLAISTGSPWGIDLPTTVILDSLCHTFHPIPTRPGRDFLDVLQAAQSAKSHQDAFRGVGHAGFSLLIGLLGGTLAV